MVQVVLVFFLFCVGQSILAYNEQTHIENSFYEDSVNIKQYSNINQNNSIWYILADVATDVFRLQNEVDSKSEEVVRSCVVVIVADNFLWKPSYMFLDSISNLQQGTQFIYLHLREDNTSVTIIHDVLDKLMDNEVTINTIAIFSENQHQIANLINALSSSINLLWTSVIHITEWIIVSISSGLLNDLKCQQLKIDFITLVIQSTSTTISIIQKSRNSNFKQVVTQTICKNVRETSNICHNLTATKNNLQYFRLHPLIYLKSKKSIMADLKIPVAISAKNYLRISYKEVVGNHTIYVGFSIELLKIMAENLGFTYNFVRVYDGGGYGEALANGTITGITGLLGRKEAGIAALVSRLENRARVIDFLPTLLMEETANIVYRLPKPSDSLDLTYIQIIQPRFLLTLVGPVVGIAIIGAVVHLATRECTSPKPRRFSKRDLRGLRSFPPHIFFLSDNYPGQTGRILIGTWGTFCLILWSAYSAYLVTTFATKPNELVINTFQQLMEHSEFRFGMLGSGNALAIIFKTSNDKLLQQMWNKLIDFNKSDPLTFSSDLPDHVRLIIGGKYAFIDNFSLASGLFYDNLPTNYTEVRAYPLTTLLETEASYVALPKRVFYKDILYNLHLELEMSGIINKLQKQYFSAPSQLGSKTKHDGDVVNFGRIEFLVYVVLAAVVVSFICLGAEFAFAWLEGNGKRRRQC